MDPTELSSTEDEPCNAHSNRDTLLKKYDIPINHLDFPYVEKCTSGKELERILHILQSGEEGHYPQLLEKTAERLAKVKPNSRFLRELTPVIDLQSLNKNEQKALQDNVDSWIKNIGNQDQELTQHKNASSFQELPEIRKSKSNVGDTQENLKIDKRIKSTDYASWDKYDPDTEILKMDLETEKLKSQVVQQNIDSEDINNNKKSQKGKSVKFAEFLTTAEAAFESTREKDKGNEFYRSGDYKSAVLCYTNSINFLPCAINYNNRAQAHIKLKLYKEAVDDCQAALRYESDNIKARLRLAQSLQELQLYQEAVTHAEKVVHLEPNNVVAQNLLNKLNQQSGVVISPKKKTRMKIVEIDNKNWATTKKSSNKTSARKSILKKSSNSHVKKNQVLLPIPGPSTMPEPYYILADNKDPELVKLQEFVINNKPEAMFLGNIDIDDDECPIIHNTRHENKSQNENKNDILEINEEKLEKFDFKETVQQKETLNINEYQVQITNENEHKTKENNQKNQGETKTQAENNMIIKNYVDSDDISSISGMQINKKDDHELVEQTNNNRNTSPEYTNTLNESLNQPGGGGEPHLDLNGNTNNNNIDNRNEIQLPFSFLRAWKSVQRDETYAQHAQVLRGLDEQRLVEIIGFKLDGTMLTDILRTLYLHFTVPHEVERLHAIINNITALPRFTISAMFLSKHDKNKVTSLFEFLEQHGLPLSNDIKQLYL